MPAPDRPDPIELTRALIRCPSVTPADEGALDVLQSALEALGFACTRLPFGEGAERVDRRRVAPLRVELANLDHGVFILATRQPERQGEQNNADHEVVSAEDTQGELL